MISTIVISIVSVSVSPMLKQRLVVEFKRFYLTLFILYNLVYRIKLTETLGYANNI